MAVNKRRGEQPSLGIDEFRARQLGRTWAKVGDPPVDDSNDSIVDEAVVVAHAKGCDARSRNKGVEVDAHSVTAANPPLSVPGPNAPEWRRLVTICAPPT